MKKWQRFMDDFCGSQRSRPLFCSSGPSTASHPQCSSQHDLIDWSSSDEEDNSKSNAPSNISNIVVRLDFDSCDPWASGLSKPSVSRKVKEVTAPQEEAAVAERATSPILLRNPRKSQVTVEELKIFQSQDDIPASPILEVKRRASPVLRRKRRNMSKDIDVVTPQKLQILEAPSSPIISAKRRPERLSRSEAQICEVETQRPVIANEVPEAVESPAKSPNLRDKASVSISPVESPVNSQRRRVEVHFAPSKIAQHKGLFAIVEESQGGKDSREQIIECPSSQDALSENLLSAPQIQSVSSVSDVIAISQNLQSDSSARDLDEPDSAIPPLDSSKKVKKPKKNGLMEHLQRIKNRQRSSYRMWLHEKQSGNKLTKGLTLRISSITNFGSKVIISGKFTQSLKQTVIVFDQEQFGKEKIKILDFVKIYPPWQTFDSEWTGVTIIISVNIFEKVEPPSDFDQSDKAQMQAESEIREFACQCSKDVTVCPSRCTSAFKENHELMDLLLKLNDSTNGCKLRAVDELESSNQETESQALDFSIADAVEVYAKKSTALLRLKLACQKIFISRKSINKEKLLMSQSSQSCEEVWSMLGMDSAGSFCFVELKGSSRLAIKEGGNYFLQGTSLHKRLEISRRPDIVSLLSATSPDWKNPPYVFKFVAGRGCMIDSCSQVQPWLPPKLTVFDPTEEETLVSRRTVVMKFLANESACFYATDQHISKNEIPYVGMSVKPKTVISKFTHGAIIIIRDLLFHRAGITLDEFTSVFEVENPPNFTHFDKMCPNLKASSLEELKKVSPEIPNLSPAVKNHQLVQMKGTICGVDEDNSYCWPVCSCGSELLQDLPNDVMCCSSCHSDGPFTNMVALSVFLNPSSGYQFCDDKNVKVLTKLHESTVGTILPGWEKDEIFFGLEAVLGQEIGPIICCVSCNEEKNPVSLCQVPF